MERTAATRLLLLTLVRLDTQEPDEQDDDVTLNVSAFTDEQRASLVDGGFMVHTGTRTAEADEEFDVPSTTYNTWAITPKGRALAGAVLARAAADMAICVALGEVD